MDNIIDLFMSMEAFRAVFQFGYIPKREEFYELTPEQYDKFYASAPNEPRGEKVFMLLPHDTQKYNELAAGDVYVCRESEIVYFDGIETLLEKYCENSATKLETLEDKLYHAAKFVPDVFTEGTKYARHKLVYLDSEKKKKNKNKNKKDKKGKQDK
jgi:hypothetical protein